MKNLIKLLCLLVISIMLGSCEQPSKTNIAGETNCIKKDATSLDLALCLNYSASTSLHQSLANLTVSSIGSSLL